VADLGQMFTWHIALLPLAVAAIVALHVVLVRMHGVVPPIDAAETDDQILHPGNESEAGR
jgi:quinol-cytochrome oxidoreductase complex cytochrome b subunit